MNKMAYKDKEEYKEYQRKWRDNNRKYILEYNKTKGKLNHKKYYEKNKEQIKKRVKENYPKIKEKSNKRSREYYKKNKERISIRKKEYKQLDYVKKRTNELIKKNRKKNIEKINARDKTKHFYPLKDKKCEFCDSLAINHHHYTEPYIFDKFWYVCKECHKNIHKEGQDVFLERQRWK